METNRKTVLGVVFIIIGVYLLLNNLNMIPFALPWYFFQWQMILIGLGIFNLLTGNRKGAFVLLTIGVLFFIPEFYPEVRVRDFWPVILVIIGVSFFMRSRHKILSDTSGASVIDELVLFAGKEKQLTSKSFQGGKITTIFGGTSLDLRDADLAGGASIETFTMFGGTEIKIPDDWQVVSNITPILGGFEDKRRKDTSVSATKTLTIHGTVMFGGVEIKRG